MDVGETTRVLEAIALRARGAMSLKQSELLRDFAREGKIAEISEACELYFRELYTIVPSMEAGYRLFSKNSSVAQMPIQAAIQTNNVKYSGGDAVAFLAATPVTAIAR